MTNNKKMWATYHLMGRFHYDHGSKLGHWRGNFEISLWNFLLRLSNFECIERCLNWEYNCLYNGPIWENCDTEFSYRPNLKDEDGLIQVNITNPDTWPASRSKNSHRGTFSYSKYDESKRIKSTYYGKLVEIVMLSAVEAEF